MCIFFKDIKYILLEGDIIDFIIKNYVNKLTEDDIYNYALKEGVKLSDYEIKVIYMYIKNYWQVFYREDARFLLDELKEKLSPNAYNKICELYKKYKK